MVEEGYDQASESRGLIFQLIVRLHPFSLGRDDYRKAVRNLPFYFYERLGFTVDAEVPTPDGAATMRPMHRPARGPTDA